MNLELIFDQLDGDRDNCISIDAINIEAVPREVSRVLMPIVQELEELDEGQGAIDRAEFVQACLRLYQVSRIMKINSYFLSSDFKCRRSQRDLELRKSAASGHG